MIIFSISFSYMFNVILYLIYKYKVIIINTFDKILQKLKDGFPGGNIILENTSSQHIGHNAKGLHLKATIDYIGFKNKSTIDCHRMVHSILSKEIGNEIHAITIFTSYKK